MSWAVTLGESMWSPAATLCTASTISVGGVCLSRKPLAPSRSARTTWSSSSNVVSTITFGGCRAGHELVEAPQAVQPRHPDVHQHDVGCDAGR